MRKLTFITLSLCLFFATATSLVHADTGFIDSEGTQIYYQSAGEGEAVILIHGFTASAAQNWVAPGIFKNLAQDHLVVAIDARGHGKSDKPHGADNYGNKMVKDIANVMDALEIDRAHIVGYSMGGFITTKFTIDYPERVISAVPGGAGWMDPNSTEPDVILELAESLENGNGIAPLIEALTPADQPKPTPEYLAAINKMLLATNDPLALAGAARGMAELSVTTKELKQNKVPMTVIVGTSDPLAQGVRAMEKEMSNMTAIYVDGHDHMSLIAEKKYLAGIRAHITANSLAERS
ncbi:MAG: alpha/beta hydrolase [Candidatus Hydrogenedentota bacterium]